MQYNFYNFTADMPPIKVGKTEAALSKMIRYNDNVYTIPDWIALKIKEGSIPEAEENYSYTYYKNGEYHDTKPKTQYRLSKGNLYNEISKTEYDLACYLVAQNATTDDIQNALKQAENERIKATEQAAEEARKTEQETKERQRQENENFKAWLKTEAEKYNNTDKLDILKSVFIHYTGGFGGGSIRLLVLIDNFDDPRCKSELIDWMHSSNKASKRTFEIITGVKLDSTDKRTKKILEGITSADFDFSNMPKANTIHFRKPAGEASENQEVYYIAVRAAEGIEFEQVLAEAYKNNYGLDLFIRKHNDNYTISEAKTGLNIASGKTKEEVKKSLKNTIERLTIQKVKNLIEESINKNGISPKYRENQESV